MPMFTVVELVSKFELPEIRKDLHKLSTTAEEDGEVCFSLCMYVCGRGCKGVWEGVVGVCGRELWVCKSHT